MTDKEKLNEAEFNYLKQELEDIADFGILPDGDKVTMPVRMWAEYWVEIIKEKNNEESF